MDANNINACIVYISSRHKCIDQSLQSLWENYNCKYNYPVYVHYFDDIYDNKVSNTEQNVKFISVPYKTPSFIPENELFYNRMNLWYVRSSFNIQRKGYLHMCNFTSNMFKYPNTEIHNHEFGMTVDDESMFVKEMPYDPFAKLIENDKVFAAMKVVDQTVKKPHQGNFDTRINLWNFVKEYISQNNIEPASSFILKLLSDPQSDYNFNFYPVADSYVINTKLFESPEWKQWINAVNESGGIYKYRWGDNDVYSLFWLIYKGDCIHDLKTVDEGYHSQGALRHLQDYAPGVKNLGL